MTASFLRCFLSISKQPLRLRQLCDLRAVQRQNLYRTQFIIRNNFVVVVVVVVVVVLSKSSFVAGHTITRSFTFIPRLLRGPACQRVGVSAACRGACQQCSGDSVLALWFDVWLRVAWVGGVAG